MGISIYLVIMIIGAILLFAILIMGFGHDVGDVHMDVGHGDIGHAGGHEIGHGSPSAFSLPVILAVVTSFGAFGVIFEAIGVNGIIIPGVSMGLAIAVGVVTFLGMYKMFKMTQSTTKLKYEDLVGMNGTVSIPISEGGEGQVIFTPTGRGRVLMAAVSDDEIERDEVVLGIELMGNVMKVKRVGPKKSGEKKESKYKRPEVK